MGFLCWPKPLLLSALAPLRLGGKAVFANYKCGLIDCLVKLGVLSSCAYLILGFLLKDAFAFAH